MRTYTAPGAGAPVFVLAHGAGAGERHPWMVRVGTGLAARGISVVTFDFPYMEAGRRVPDRPQVLEARFQAVVAEVAAKPPSTGPLFAGGKSMGGRIGSQAAAAGLLSPAPRGLVFFGYPLHPPGKPGQRRDAHLPSIGRPLLFVQGSRDPFGSPEEMTALVSTLPDTTLELVTGGDHSLKGPKRDDPNGRMLDAALDRAAGWMLALIR